MGVVPLLTYEDGVYTLHEPTLAILEKRAKSFAVLACTGKFRGGKSFLLNRLTRQAPGKGFGVGDTVQACTRGIWMSDEFLEGTDGAPDVLIMDTEGLGATEAQEENDVRIFALAVLLSSALAYNSTSHIDESAIRTLSFMTSVAQSVGTVSGHTLYWILRDFELQVTDPEGRKCTHAEYLDRALSATGDKCATRDAIKSVFATQKLVTLPRPHKGDTAQKLDAKGTSALTAKFVSFLDQWRTHLCAHSTPVTADGVPMTGAVYAAYVRAVVGKLNADGAVPRVQDTWTLVARVQHDEAARGVLAASCAEAEAACTVAPEEEVRAWCEDVVRRHVATTSFLAPAPGVDGMVARLAPDVLRHCRALGRVEDVDTLVRRCLDTAPLVPTAFDPRRHPEPVRPLFACKVLEALCDGAWDAAMRHASSLETQRLEAEVAHRDAELRAARAREEEATRRAAEEARLPSREDASTMTDEVVAHPLDDATLVDTTETDRRVELAQERVAHAESETRAVQRRLADVSKAFEENMDAMRTETAERLAEHRTARDAACKEAQTCKDQAAALRDECDKLRALAREAQERAVDAHKSFLDEVRRRDEEARASADAHRRAYAEEHAKAESAATEARGLKRRVDELLVDVQEVKRLRSAAHATEVERAKEDTEREFLRTQLAQTREEREALRAHTASLETRLAVLEASQKLDTCRKSLL